ncbi:cobalamin biosynthesis protein [Nocardioides speluncae]|uniref:cobalamin biosynthesis protein n=1 Tax=Nocardioides speluncae TaxID=2670337 RepID=UPI000D69D3BA|nr:cobalamin biosynthesis protein [Nocardioides speluncae]
MGSRARALGLAAGFLADRAFGDPRRGHPVALFGRVAGGVERVGYADSRARGAAYTVLLVGGTAVVAEVAQRRMRGGVAEVVVVAVSTFTVLGGTSLVREAEAMARLLEADDLAGARDRLSHVCARDAADLESPDLARATVESVAENTSDAVVAPLFWGALFGVPGLLGYRAANTLDAMVGYRSARYERFGWASARVDDLLNLPPARVAAMLTVAVADRPGDAWRIWRRDGAHHPSPNAGQVEAAAAGALGVRLGGANDYFGVTENRGVMGDGRPVDVADVRRSAALSRRVSSAATVAAVLGALVAARAADALPPVPAVWRRR